MKRCLLIVAMVALAGCSGSSSQTEPTSVPSTILLPASAPPVAPVMLIGELIGSALNDGNTWRGVAEITMLTLDGEPVAGALVSGAWDEGDTEDATCTTDAAGTCRLESDSIRKRVPRTVFEITDIDHSELSYRADLDMVDEPESQPRELTVRKP